MGVVPGANFKSMKNLAQNYFFGPTTGCNRAEMWKPQKSECRTSTICTMLNFNTLDRRGRATLFKLKMGETLISPLLIEVKS